MHGTWQIVRRLSKPRHTGEVFEVRDAQGQAGALKRFVPKCRGGRALFERERKFNEDQAVPDVMPRWLGSGTDEDGNPFFVTEVVTTLGSTFTTPVREDADDTVIETLKEIAAACARLRDAGYYHCDLKPSNIGWVRGRLVLIDFGCALRIGEASRQRVAAGSEFYRAPEVAHGIISEASEVYSLGRTAYVLSGWATRFRLSAAIFDATEKLVDLRTQTFEAFAASLDRRDADFVKLLRLTMRIWRTAIIAACTAATVVAIAYGGIMASSYAHRREKLEKAIGENEARAAKVDLIVNQGCRRLESGSGN